MEPAEFVYFDALLHGLDLPDLRLEDLVCRPEWMQRARCRDLDTEQFFPGRGVNTEPVKKVCRQCPVAAECREYALESGEHFGIWGGTSERERRSMRSTRPAALRRAGENERPCDHCQEPAPAATRTGLCRLCRMYEKRFGHRPDTDALAVRARRRAS